MIENQEMPQTRLNPYGDPLLISEDANLKQVENEIQRLTYPQDWKNYNDAQTKEKYIAEQLLLELLDSFETKELKLKGGRPGWQLKYRIYCMFMYVLSSCSSRRCISDLYMVRDRKIIPAVPHFNSVLNFFGNKSATKILSKLIRITSLPLISIESHFAVDSSGFSTSRFQRWFNVRTQKTEKKRDYKKAHITVGAKSNIITSVKITNGFAADCPELIPLVEQTNEFFDMSEVSADKAYLSRANLQYIARVGAVPYIPFKSNSKPNCKGSVIWKRMHEYFMKNRERFLKSYHLRSNVETTFHMIKRKYGNNLKTKKGISQINEILVKCLCHNLACLVHESFELGLKIDLSFCANQYSAQKPNE